MVLVPQLCRGLGIFMYTAVLVNIPGVLVWERCRRAKVVPSYQFHPRVPVFYLQTGWSESFRELTMKTVIPIGHSTILRRFVKWLLQTYYEVIWDCLIKEANIWKALSDVCVNLFALSLTLKNAHGFNFASIWPLPNSNQNICSSLEWWAETLAPDDLQNKSLTRPLTAKKGYIHVFQTWTSGYFEGKWVWHQNHLRRFMVRGWKWPCQCRRGSRFWFSLLLY